MFFMSTIDSALDTVMFFVAICCAILSSLPIKRNGYEFEECDEGLSVVDCSFLRKIQKNMSAASKPSDSSSVMGHEKRRLFHAAFSFIRKDPRFPAVLTYSGLLVGCAK